MFLFYKISQGQEMLKSEYVNLYIQKGQETQQQSQINYFSCLPVLLCQILPKTQIQTRDNISYSRKISSFAPKMSAGAFQSVCSSENGGQIPQENNDCKGLLVRIVRQIQHNTQVKQNKTSSLTHSDRYLTQQDNRIAISVYGTRRENNIIQFRHTSHHHRATQKLDEDQVTLKIKKDLITDCNVQYQHMYVICQQKSTNVVDVVVVVPIKNNKDYRVGMNKDEQILKCHQYDDGAGESSSAVNQMSDSTIAHFVSTLTGHNQFKELMKIQLYFGNSQGLMTPERLLMVQAGQLQKGVAWVCKISNYKFQYKKINLGQARSRELSLLENKKEMGSQAKLSIIYENQSRYQDYQGQLPSGEYMNIDPHQHDLDAPMDTFSPAPTQHQSLAQGQLYLLDDLDQQDQLSQLKEVNQSLRSSNIFSMMYYWSQTLKNKLVSFCDNLNIYQEAYQVELGLFVRLNQFKMLKMNFDCRDKQVSADNLYQTIYPDITATVKYIIDKIGLTDLPAERQEFYRSQLGYYRRNCPDRTSREQIDYLFLDELMKIFEIESETSQDMKMYKAITKYQQMCSNDGQVTLEHAEYLLSTMKETMSWKNQQNQETFIEKNIYKRISDSVYSNVPTHRPYDQSLLSATYLNNIVFQKTPNMRCLGCSEFFFSEMNLYDSSVCQTPLKLFPSIMKVKYSQDLLKDWVCAMLNSGGGVVLFNCTQEGNKIYPQGQFLTEKKKQQIQQKLLTYFQHFVPHIQILKHFKISFVPIKNNPLTSSLNNKKPYSGEEGVIKQGQWYYERQFSKGFFVTRILVKPTNGWQVYYWHKTKKDQKDERQDPFGRYCYTFENDQAKLLSTKQMNRLIKKNFKQHYLPQSMLENDKRMMTKPFSYFDHECSQPQVLPHVVQSQIKEIANSVPIPSVPVSQMKVKKEEKNEHTSINQSKYSNMTLLIAKRSDLQRIKAKLQEHDIDCAIEIRFQKHKLRPANNSAIIYHDKPFEQVRNILINVSQFNFYSGRPVLLIAIQKLIYIDQKNGIKLDMNFMNRCQSYMKGEFSSQKLRFFNNESFYNSGSYILSASKLVSLYLYFVLSHQNIKVSFSSQKSEKMREIVLKSPQQKPENLINDPVFDFF